MGVPPVVGLEIGTSKVIALVGELREDGHVMITGMGEHPSTGIRKSEVVDLENAGMCVRGALEMAEESSKVAIGRAHLGISGAHIQSLVNRGTTPVLDPDGEISEDDVDQVIEVARTVNLPPERKILHTICQHFWIDDQTRVVRPEGMEGAKLAVDMLVLHGVRSRLHNAVRIVRSIPLDVQDVAFTGLSAALAVLTPEQKQGGAIVIDLGGGTTDYFVYAGNIPAAAGVIAVGGDHVTNDIAAAFSIPQRRAENLKCESGCAFVDPTCELQRISLPAEAGFPGRTILMKSLHQVINARMDELLIAIRKRLERAHVLHMVGAGVVLTGGGAHLPGITELVERIFGLPCSIGKPRHVSGLATATEGPEYAACAGLVQYGFRTMGENTGGGGGLSSLLRSWFGKS